MELLQNRAAISVRKSKIEEDGMVDILFKRNECLATGLCTVHMKSFEFEQVSQRHHDVSVILDHQYGMRRPRFDPRVRSWL